MMRRYALWPLLSLAARAAPPPPPACVAVVIFKDSASGSTFFQQVLNAIPGVDVKNELFNSKSASLPASSKTALARAALKPPAACSGQRLFGFSVNPHHAAGVDWAAVRRKQPFRALVWDRSNYVKKAVSGVLQALPGCRNHNIQRVKQAQRCRRQRSGIAPAEFLARVRAEACDSADLYAAAAAAVANASAVPALTYEAFRASTKGEVSRAFRELGLRPVAAAKHKARTIKRTPEGLRHVLTDYAALSDGLAAWSPPACDLRAMLKDAKGQAFACDAAAVCAHLRRVEKAGNVKV